MLRLSVELLESADLPQYKAGIIKNFEGENRLYKMKVESKGKQ